jgi:hypothetical protein
MAVSVKLEKNILKIEVPLEKPRPSKSGKTQVVGSSHGLITTDVKYQGMHVVLSLNALIYPREEEYRQRARVTMLKMDKKLK